MLICYPTRMILIVYFGMITTAKYLIGFSFEDTLPLHSPEMVKHCNYIICFYCSEIAIPKVRLAATMDFSEDHSC